MKRTQLKKSGEKQTPSEPSKVEAKTIDAATAQADQQAARR